jgi:hypothetical protein
MDPFSGNPFGLRIRALDVGGSNFAMAGLNETITRQTGEGQAQMQLYQASRARAAARSAKQMGMMGAMMTIAKGAFQAFQTSVPGSTSTLTPNPGGAGFGFQTNQYSMLANPSFNSAPYLQSTQRFSSGLQQGFLR